MNMAIFQKRGVGIFKDTCPSHETQGKKTALLLSRRCTACQVIGALRLSGPRTTLGFVFNEGWNVIAAPRWHTSSLYRNNLRKIQNCMTGSRDSMFISTKNRMDGNMFWIFWNLVFIQVNAHSQGFWKNHFPTICIEKTLTIYRRMLMLSLINPTMTLVQPKKKHPKQLTTLLITTTGVLKLNKQ